MNGTVDHDVSPWVGNITSPDKVERINSFCVSFEKSVFLACPKLPELPFNAVSLTGDVVL